jgi:hypothetical protein
MLSVSSFSESRLNYINFIDSGFLIKLKWPVLFASLKLLPPPERKTFAELALNLNEAVRLFCSGYQKCKLSRGGFSTQEAA